MNNQSTRDLLEVFVIIVFKIPVPKKIFKLNQDINEEISKRVETIHIKIRYINIINKISYQWNKLPS